MPKDKSLHITPKQLGLEDNPMIKDEEPLASDSGEAEPTSYSRQLLANAVSALRADGHKVLAAELETVFTVILASLHSTSQG